MCLYDSPIFRAALFGVEVKSREPRDVIPRERSDRRNLLIGFLSLAKVPNLRKDFGEFHVRLEIPAKWAEPQWLYLCFGEEKLVRNKEP